MKVPVSIALVLLGLGSSRNARAQSPVGDFLSAEVPALMKRFDIPGAVVVVTHGDQVLVNQGFGVADRPHAKPVDPNTTRFRVASVAKVFTALAVMNMIKQGRIRLDEDVHTWVPGIPLNPANRPVTMRQLLTHTGDFDERKHSY